MKQWALFMISFGCVIVLLSYASNMDYGAITGVGIAIAGFIMLLKKGKGDS